MQNNHKENQGEKKVLLRITDLKQWFPIKKTKLFQKEQLYVRANDGITLDIYAGETVGLVGESAGNGAVKSGDVTVGVATGAAETAGLPDATVSTIKALNSSASLSSVLPGLGLEAFAKVGGTRAIVAKNAAGQDAPTAVSMFVDKLPANATVTVVCFNNATGQWMTITNVTVDAATKTVNFTVPGSCTVQIAVK